jgi:hypothetical protein
MSMVTAMSLVFFFESALGALASAGAGSSSQVFDADLIVNKFLRHMEDNQPIAGVFEIEQKLDPVITAQQRRRAQAEVASRGQKVKSEPTDRLLECRWAWDGTREMVETLAGSRNIETNFYRNREGFLLGLGNRKFNLDVSRANAPEWRPGSFYHFPGNSTWRSLLSNCKFTSEAAPDGRRGSTILTATRPGLTARLTLDKDSGSLYSYKLDIDGKPYARLAILELSRGRDQRVFPSRATLQLYVPSHPDRPQLSARLNATRVVFPSSRTELDAAFEMKLPAGTEIFDTALNRLTVLEAPMSAEDAITTPLPSMPLDSAATAAVSTAPSMRFAVRFLVGIVVLIGLLTLYRLFRGRLFSHG